MPIETVLLLILTEIYSGLKTCCSWFFFLIAKLIERMGSHAKKLDLKPNWSKWSKLRRKASKEESKTAVMVCWSFHNDDESKDLDLHFGAENNYKKFSSVMKEEGNKML